MRAQLSVFEEQFASLHQSMRSCAQLTGVDPLNPSAPPDARYVQQSEASNAPKAADGVAVLAPDGLEIKLANHLDAQGGLAKAQQVESYLQQRQGRFARASGAAARGAPVHDGDDAARAFRSARRAQSAPRLASRRGDVERHAADGPGSRRAPRASGHGGGGARVRNRQGGEEDPQTVARGGDGDFATEDDSAAKDAVASRADALISMWMRVLKDQRTAPAAAPARAAATEPPRKRARPPLPLSETAAAAEARRVRRGAGCCSGQHGIERRASRHRRGEREQG